MALDRSFGSSGFRGAVFGIGAFPDTVSICNYDGSILPFNALTIVESHTGTGQYSNNIDCTTYIPAEYAVTTFGHVRFSATAL